MPVPQKRAELARNGKRVPRIRWQAGDSLETFVRRHYCVYGPDGEEDRERLNRTLAAVQVAHPDLRAGAAVPPVPVDGVPFLRAVVERVEDVPALVRRFLPVVEADPRLHALSFIDPLRLASDELGIRIAPKIARLIRWRLRYVVSFDAAAAADAANRVARYSQARWRPKSNRGDRDAV